MTRIVRWSQLFRIFSAACAVTMLSLPVSVGVRGQTIANAGDGTASIQTIPGSGTVTPAAVGVENYQGLWWNANEDGWGITFAHQGDRVYAVWYTYDTVGNAYWLSMLASRTDSTSKVYTGPITSNVGTPFNNYTGNSPAVPVGDGILTFSDADNGTFEYTITAAGGATNVHHTKPITRYILTGGPRLVCDYSLTADIKAATNYQDLWWVPAESGWGVNFAHEGSLLYATWYTYGTNNAPTWLSALMQQSSSNPNRYTATAPPLHALWLTSGPRFDNYRASERQVGFVGTATVLFYDGMHADFSYTTLAGSGLPGVTQTKSITRFLFSPGTTICR